MRYINQRFTNLLTYYNVTKPYSEWPLYDDDLPSPSTSTEIPQATVEESRNNRHHKPVAGQLAVGFGGQFQLSGRPRNLTPQFLPSPASEVTAESF